MERKISSSNILGGQSSEAAPDLANLALDHSQVGVVVCDAGGFIRYMNERYGEIFNIDIHEAIGRHITDYFFKNAQIPRVAKSGRPDVGVRFFWKNQEMILHRTPVLEDGKVKWVMAEVIFRDIDELKQLAKRMHLLEQKVDYFKQKIRDIPSTRFTLEDIKGSSPEMKALGREAKRFAESSQPVLILGESGTGKEMLAHGVHSAGPRASELFVSVNCASIPKDLLESELFGYEGGAFTGARREGKIGKFELADNGTIFLDEIGDLPLEMQAKLLRVIEYKEIERIGGSKPIFSDFRLIAATNKDLEELVKKGRFREELYFRLNVLVLRIPPLRERIQDIPDLCQHFLKTAADVPAGSRIALGPEVKKLFQRYSWPGNVREVQNIINFSINSLEQRQNTIEIRHIPKYLLKEVLFKPRALGTPPYSLRKFKEACEKEAISNVLNFSNKNKVRASKLLGISRNALYKKIKKYKLTASSRGDATNS
jgi:transcriptional regulator with PAS, ATPase and Fis domain